MPGAHEHDWLIFNFFYFFFGNSYALVREQTRSTFQKVVVTGEQIKEVESIVTWKCVDTDQLLLPTDIKFYYLIGSEPIVFTKDELAEVRTFTEPGKLRKEN